MDQAVKNLPGLKPLDADRIEKELRLPARIEERKEPSIESEECDASLANDLAAHLGQASQDALQDVRARLIYHNEQASKACTGLDFEKEKNHIKGIQNQISVSIERDRSDLIYTHQQYKDAKKHFDKYKADRDLIAPAKLGASDAMTASYLALLVLAEALFNAIFLAPVDPQGLIWGGFTAVILAFVSVFVGFGVGYGAKNIWSKHIPVKLVGFFIALLGTTFLPLFHYLVMKYRSEMSLLGEEIELGAEFQGLATLLARTVESILNTPFHVNDFNSLIIFLIGAILAFLAAQKGYSLGDKYPGYTNQRMQFDSVREQHISLRNNNLAYLESLRNDAIDSIRDFIERAETGQKLAKNYANSSMELLQSYRTFEQSLKSTAQHMISRYVEPLAPREKAKVRKFVDARVNPSIEHDDDLQALVGETRQAAQISVADAERARELAEELRSKTIDAIETQIIDFRRQFSDVP